MIVYIDASIAGISGNMVLGALLSLGAEEEALRRVAGEVARETGCEVGVEVREVRRKGVRAKHVEVNAGGGIKAWEMEDALAALLENLGLSEEARGFSSKTLDTLFRAEMAVHGVEEPCLHELGSADTLVDILGAARLGEDLGFFRRDARLYASPVLVGSGRVETSHGSLTVPAPVTAEILRSRGIPFRFSLVKGELATPTGVAILGNLVHSYGYPPYPIRIESHGAGAGGLELEEAPNILRIMLCTPEPEVKAETVATLETDVDDVSGEVLGYLLERLYDEGALDVQVLPTVTKKNRPGYMVFVLCGLGAEGRLARVLMRETGTLGVRVSTAQMRYAVERETKRIRISLPGYEGDARVKVSFIGGVKHVKAEYEDARRIAMATGMPLKDVIREVERQGKRLIS